MNDARVVAHVTGPKGQDAFAAMLDFYLLDKAIYELRLPTDSAVVAVTRSEPPFVFRRRLTLLESVTVTGVCAAFGEQYPKRLVAVAIKGLPRERLFIQTKMPWEREPFKETGGRASAHAGVDVEGDLGRSFRHLDLPRLARAHSGGSVRPRPRRSRSGSRHRRGSRRTRRR
mgnify:CR=1 FL=1